jgi:hypothetical protein|nr:MAG TPA: Major tail protein [Caudoviricetes sp.]
MIDDANPYVESNFSWAEWTPNTTLKLCRVPWDASYRDIVRFVSRKTQQEWFDKLDGVECRPATMHIFGAPVRIEMPFNQASNYNYLVAVNDYPELESPRAWYYFIESVEYINAHTTQLTLMLDVWQSFQHDVTFGSCYVTRGHIGVANERQWDDYGRTTLALPEGLDTGAETVVTSQSYKALMSSKPVQPGFNSPTLDYGVIVVATTDLEASGGSAEKPSLKTAQGSQFENQSNGAGVYYFDTADDFTRIMQAGSSFPWVTQGITAIYAVPKISADYVADAGREVTQFFGNGTAGVIRGHVYTFLWEAKSDNRYDDIVSIRNFRDNFNIPNRYRNLRKLRCYPYSIVECSCLNGSNVIYRPEDIQSDDLVIRETWNYAPPSPRLNFYPVGYNAGGAATVDSPSGNGAGLPIDGGEMLNVSFGITNFPQFMVVNNGAALAMANSAYSRAYAEQSAGWAQQKATMSAQNALSQAGIGITTGQQMTQLGVDNRNATNAIATNSMNQSLAINQANTNAMTDLTISQNNSQMGWNLVSNTVGSFASGSPGQLVGGTVGALVQNGIANTGARKSRDIANDTASANTANAISSSAAQTSQANSYALRAQQIQGTSSALMAGQNYRLATRFAEGDYENAIAGINAQVQQMRMTPPTTSGAAGGDSFNLANGIMGVLVRFRTCAPSALRSVGEFMLRFGYFVQRFITPPASLQCMEKFTYWQMQECYVRGMLPEQARLTIKGMFERGVTVWDRPEYIGVTDWADNDPLPGIGYE